MSLYNNCSKLLMHMCVCVCGGVRHTVKSPCLHKSGSHFAVAGRQESPSPPTCSLLARRRRRRRPRATNATTVDLNNETRPLSMWLHKYYIDNLTFTGFPVWRKLPSHLSEAEAEVLERRRALFPPTCDQSPSPPSPQAAGPMHLFTG